MKRIRLTFVLAGVLWLGLWGTAQAYYIEYLYSPTANYSDALALDYTSNFVYTKDENNASAAEEAGASAFQISAESQVYTRPVTDTGAVTDISLKVNNNTTYYSYAYGYSDSFFEFIIYKDPGDSLSQVEVKVDFQATGGFNLADGATSTYDYALKLNGNEIYYNSGGYDASGAHVDPFVGKFLLDVGVAHTFQLIFSADLDHASITPNEAWYKGKLGLSPAPLPTSVLLLGSGLLGLGLLKWRRKG